MGGGRRPRQAPGEAVGRGARLTVELPDEGRTLTWRPIDWRPGKPVFQGGWTARPSPSRSPRPPRASPIRHRAAKAKVLVLTPRSAELHDKLPEKQAADTSKLVLSPMPGLVVSMDVVPASRSARARWSACSKP
jgi:propionyl-CoA carboxylase alpha chain